MGNASTQLKVNIGKQSVAGKKAINEDATLYRIPQSDCVLANKGICCALADGVSTAEAGKQASETAVKRFVDDYYLSPDTWSVAHCGEKILSATNLSLFKKSHAYTSEQKGFLCTFVGLVLKSQLGHFFHIGDSRIYRLVNNELTQLTRDHNAFVGEGKSYLTRALGMDNNLHVDYGKINLSPGELYLLSSDGVHDFISSELMLSVLEQPISCQQKAENLVKLALAQGSDDNLSCIVIEIESVANESIDDFNAKLTRLPFPPPLEKGMKLDGFRILKELFASSRSQLYLVEDLSSGEQLVMKTPSVNFIDDNHYIDRFIQEEWIGKRLASDRIVKVYSQNRPRTCLYYLMEHVEGVGLDVWMKKNPLPSPKTAIEIVKQIAQGLADFHEKETIHQDLKPANIIIDDRHNIKIVDFGSTFVAGTAEIFNPIEHEGALGTATYSDPQCLLGKNTGVQGDLYALTTIAYEIFTGHLPYGDSVEECKNVFDYDRLRYIQASYHNPVIPIWFDKALEKGVQINPEKRYKTLAALLTDLTKPNPRFLLDVPETTQEKSRARFWLVLSAIWVLMFLLVIVLFKS
ncbi:bifunctional protein-serine/threonine kinase/phosphatase [Thalassotalea marina]|uniref:Protein kinase n=1 Tax=Thalassotalea marina TaxID=1673741 RepID=A0A919EKC7_9GAMM|nr:bifunctional protein-serine/threonine kinase/phosphatase [Thalassotalea marina]GHF91913.1 protein kinase [Thalassotalea marina]